MDVTELQIAGILHETVIGIDRCRAASLLDGIARVGHSPAVGNLTQWVVIVAITTVQTTGECIEEFVAIAAAEAHEEVPVLISHLGIEAIGELRLDIP